MLCSVYTTIAGEYDGPGFCTPIGTIIKIIIIISSKFSWNNNCVVDGSWVAFGHVVFLWLFVKESNYRKLYLYWKLESKQFPKCFKFKISIAIML